MNYFDDIEKQEGLKKVLDSWIGTPYKHKIGVKGRGCDCVHFGGKVFEEMGLLNFKYLSIPDYPRDWHMHETRELLCAAIEKYLKVSKHDVEENLINGDIIVFHYGKASSHVGIVFDGYVYQSLDNIGVKKINFNDVTFKKHMKFVYRIIS